MAVSAFRPAQTGEIVALKKVALRRLEDGIPNQALREIKALQEIEDNQYVSEAGPGSGVRASPPASTHSHSGGPTPSLLAYMLPPLPTSFLIHVFTLNLPIHSSPIHFLVHPTIHELLPYFSNLFSDF